MRPAVSMLLALLLLADLRAAEFIFINGDGPGEGLNDPTVVAAVGGNPATTRGGQRLAALQRVGEIWGAFLVSEVPIRVSVEFDPLPAGTLAQASAESVQENFANAPRPDVWYPVALANSLAGIDLAPGLADIAVTANSNGSFYYGLDSASPGGLSNFVDVLLHEFGHGLGFISFASPSSGNLFLGQSDIFTDFLFDRQLGAAWPDLTATSRAISATNDPYLVWTGPFTTAGLPRKLSPQVSTAGFRLTATLPDTTTLQPGYLRAQFDGPVPSGGLNRPLVITDTGAAPPADPTGACGPIINAAQVAGNIAFIRRGVCDFDSKVFAAQQAGAVGVIIANNVDTGLLVPRGDRIVDGVAVNITIPALFVSRQDGDALFAASPGVQIAIAPIPAGFAGASDGQARLHAPANLSEGSSVSHWATAASPNLLMEPFINPGLDRKLDLTLTQMKDIGWKVIDIPFPHLTFDSWTTLVFAPSDPLTDPADDPDSDGVENLEEYFFGTDPKRSDASRLPVFSFTGGDGDLVFTRSKLPTDLSYTLEKSTTLESFVPAVEGVDYAIGSLQSLGTDAEEITLRLINPPGGLFLRLRIDSDG